MSYKQLVRAHNELLAGSRRQSKANETYRRVVSIIPEICYYLFHTFTNVVFVLPVKVLFYLSALWSPTVRWPAPLTPARPEIMREYPLEDTLDNSEGTILTWPLRVARHALLWVGNFAFSAVIDALWIGFSPILLAVKLYLFVVNYRTKSRIDNLVSGMNKVMLITEWCNDEDEQQQKEDKKVDPNRLISHEMAQRLKDKAIEKRSRNVINTIARRVSPGEFYSGMIKYHIDALEANKVSAIDQHYRKYLDARYQYLQIQSRWSLAKTIFSGLFILPLLITIPAHLRLLEKISTEYNVMMNEHLPTVDTPHYFTLVACKDLLAKNQRDRAFSLYNKTPKEGAVHNEFMELFRDYDAKHPQPKSQQRDAKEGHIVNQADQKVVEVSAIKQNTQAQESRNMPAIFDRVRELFMPHWSLSVSGATTNPVGMFFPPVEERQKAYLQPLASLIMPLEFAATYADLQNINSAIDKLFAPDPAAQAGLDNQFLVRVNQTLTQMQAEINEALAESDQGSKIIFSRG